MESKATPAALIDMLNSAIAREIQVSIQYMLQHAIWNVKRSASGGGAGAESGKFVGGHIPFLFPGSNLKRIAITEMRHAEAVAERIVQLGGEPTTEPAPITIGDTPREVLENDKAAEEGAIILYNQIIDLAAKGGDEITEGLFKKILAEEEEHHKTFAELLEKA